jgi:hypothetical protein
MYGRIGDALADIIAAIIALFLAAGYHYDKEKR